jgi:hypothetical protein
MPIIFKRGPVKLTVNDDNRENSERRRDIRDKNERKKGDKK